MLSHNGVLHCTHSHTYLRCEMYFLYFIFHHGHCYLMKSFFGKLWELNVYWGENNRSGKYFLWILYCNIIKWMKFETRKLFSVEQSSDFEKWISSLLTVQFEKHLWVQHLQTFLKELTKSPICSLNSKGPNKL